MELILCNFIFPWGSATLCQRLNNLLTILNLKDVISWIDIVALLRGQDNDFFYYYNAHDETKLGKLSLDKIITTTKVGCNSLT